MNRIHILTRHIELCYFDRDAKIKSGSVTAHCYLRSLKYFSFWFCLQNNLHAQEVNTPYRAYAGQESSGCPVEMTHTQLSSK